MRLPFAVLAFALAAAGARAQNEVYDPEPPRGSAYLRFVNGMGAAVEIRPDFLPQLRLGAATADRVAPYRVVERVGGRALAVEVREGSRTARATVSAPAEGFVTVLVHPGPDGAPRVTAVNEEMNFNRARVRVGFYNAVPGCAAATLRVAPDGAAIFEGVAPGQARHRTVNPVRAQVQATCPGAAPAAMALEGLEAGASFSAWLVQGPGGASQAFLTRDATIPWRR